MYNGAEKRIGKGRFCREFAVKTNKIMDLNTVKTVVVKIGTSTLTYENGKMNLSLLDIDGELLIVPNFTLYGDARKGRRPGYSGGAAPDVATVLFDKLCAKAKSMPIKKVATGQFQADMKVALINDGPVTLLLDSEKLF